MILSYQTPPTEDETIPPTQTTTYEVRGLWQPTVRLEASSSQDARAQYHAAYPGATSAILSVREIAPPPEPPTEEATAP